MERRSDARESETEGPTQQIQVDNSTVNEYIKELLREKTSFEPGTYPHSMRLLEEEIVKSQAKGKVTKETKYVDIYREKPVRVAVKVLVPVKEHPRHNFVGMLLGPKGNTLKGLQEETMTRMSILGRGSMKDKAKEEEWRNNLDPKYSHLSEDLHVEIAALAPPAEAHARIAYALTELRKYLIPEISDGFRQDQMRELNPEGPRGPPPPRRPPPPHHLPPPHHPPPPHHAPVPRPPPPPPVVHPPPHRMGGSGPVPHHRGGPGGEKKVLSILDRARQAMEEPSYGGGEYEEAPYYPPSQGGYGGGGDYNGSGGDYYESSGGGSSYQSGGGERDGGGGGRWKGGYKSERGGGAGGRGGGAHHRGGGGHRAAPYSRPNK